MNEWIITTAITLGIGAITYFLKRTMNQVDNHGKEIQQLNMEVVKKNDLKESTEETTLPKKNTKKILMNAEMKSSRLKQST